MNGSPLANTKILVVENGHVLQTINTGPKSDFLIKLQFGSIYQVYLQNARSPLMFFEVIANKIPADKYSFRMPHELIVPLVEKMDDDIDTTVYKDPFYKIVFNGVSQMVADTLYNHHFSTHVLKKQNNKTQRSLNATQMSNTYIGKIVCAESKTLNLNGREVVIWGQAGSAISTISTNRFGLFTLRITQPLEISEIRMQVTDSVFRNKTLNILNTKDELISSSALVSNQYKWVFKSGDGAKLIDNAYTAHVGGKMVVSSQKQKRFFAEKTVYLLNKMHTVIEQTKTNIIGSFVFNELKPEQIYCIAIDKTEILPGEKIDILNKNDRYIASLDTVCGDKVARRLLTNRNKVYNELLIEDADLKMDIKATIFGDNVNNPIGNLKIVLLNDEYEPIDSVLTDDFGTFKFQYLPFLKRFYLSADNTDNVLDVFKNILIYSMDDNLIKIMTHQKGKKFQFKPLSAEIVRIREIEIEDPWLELMDDSKSDTIGIDIVENKLIVENIMFENNKYELTGQAKEVLDKIILVMNKQKQLKIEIGAHTDNKGSDMENLKLSQLRAKSVYNYILAAGVEEKRLVSIGYGESKPLVKCGDKQPCTEDEHAKNRRIEFKILDNKQSAK